MKYIFFEKLQMKKQIGYIILMLMFLFASSTWGAVRREKFTSGNNYLIIEALDDDLIHFELSALGPGPDPNSAVYTTPMVHKTDYKGPAVYYYDPNENTIDTGNIKVIVDTSTLAVTLIDKTRNPDITLTSLTPLNLAQDWKGLFISPEAIIERVYGLGEEFIEPGSSEGDWVGRIRSPGGPYGNNMVRGWNKGDVANCQFPIMYAVGENFVNYALFMDNVYKQEWNFTDNPWKAEMWGDQLRWYIMTGPNLPDLRTDYMELVGRPLVPPKKAFGLWISENSYDDWGELDEDLNSLRRNKFPVDCFVLDLQWFGGIERHSDDTSMGTLTWDTNSFPDPNGKIASLKNDEGIGIILIEESYIGRNLIEHKNMEERRYLAKDCENGPATYLDSWWGKGGMIDWTDPNAGDFWHDWKRQPLIDDGIVGHWADLGEPEDYNPQAWYYGFPILKKYKHADIHNIYNFRWIESIKRGYERNQVNQRPFILSRSGAPGIQRFGTAMWSGDIGSNLSSLATQLNAQMHMSMSGIDYFGADIGGFKRKALEGDEDEMYTQWFANGVAFDIPARPHTDNPDDWYETAPDKIGDVPSNLENIRQRYELVPYMYSLAHRAYLYGEPVIPPLVYYYQNDENVWEMGHEKLIGKDLLVAIVAAHGESQRDVYLPAGVWVNYHSNEFFHSTGQWFLGIPEYRDEKFKLPMFAKRGAIIPKMYVDNKTMNVFGRRTDGSVRDELIIRVYADETETNFTLYEDDGNTMNYQNGDVRRTEIYQKKSGNTITVSIQGAVGQYSGESKSRNNIIELVVEEEIGIDNVNVKLIVNGGEPTEVEPRIIPGDNLIIAESGKLSTDKPKIFQFEIKPVIPPTQLF